MAGPVLDVVLGILFVGWGLWHLPSRMARIRGRIDQREQRGAL